MYDVYLGRVRKIFLKSWGYNNNKNIEGKMCGMIRRVKRKKEGREKGKKNGKVEGKLKSE